MNPVHYSSASDRHNTPQWLVERIRDFLKGISLDPCTDESNPCGAGKFYTPAMNGLSYIWYAQSVYMNPPYGRAIGVWTSKLAREYEKGRINEAIALLPARTDTQWWEGINRYPVLFLKGRLKFNDCDQSAPFPSALIYMGYSDIRFAFAFRDLGQVYIPVFKPVKEED